jgi:hypothetical protein
VTLPRTLLLACLASATIAPAAPETPPAPAPEIRADSGPVTPIRLFSIVEEAWAASDTDRLTSLVDTTVVRIAVKPGAPLTSALTRVAAAFLLQDQLRLVRTQAFQVRQFNCDQKRRLCRATAIWTGDWGGRQGKRAVRVTLTARPAANGWLITEIRAED